MKILINDSLCTCVEHTLTLCYCDDESTHFEIALSDEGKQVFEFVNFVLLCGLFVLFGMSANIINIIIFYKQGFSNTANIAFLGLAVSDLFCLFFLGWASISLNPFLPAYDVVWVPLEVMQMSAAWPHICFCRITSFITVYITAERFISIAWPLKVKQIVTARKTAVIICLIYFVNILTFIPEYATTYLGPRFVPSKNRTLIGIIFTNNRNDVAGVCPGIHSLLSATSFIGVVVFTLLLVFKLKQTSQWRKEAVSSEQQKVAAPNKERKTVKMIVLIASILIICYTPGAIIAMAMLVVGPEFSIKGKYINICEAAWSFANVSQSVNSSVNIFLYYNMSTKYRQTFDATVAKNFKLKCKGNSKS